MTFKLQHLQCVNGWYRYRRRWPKAVRAVAPGDHFIRVLRTDDRAQALTLRPRVEIEYLEEVARHARRTDAEARQLSQPEVDRLFANWLNMESRAWAAGQPTTYSDALHAECLADFKALDDACRHMISRRNYADVEGEIRRYLEEQGIKARLEHPGYQTFVEYCVRGWKELNLQHWARLDGEPDYRFKDRVVSAAMDSGQQVGMPKGRRTVADLIDAYRKDKEQSWSPSTKGSYEPVFRLLAETFGRSREVASITRQDARDVFEMVKKLPTNLGKQKALKGLSVPEAVKLASRLGLATIRPKTINGSYLGFLQVIFKWAENEHWIVANPFKGLGVVDPVDDSEKRDPFTVEQLNVIFSLPPWSSRADGEMRATLRFWGPLLALFTGMRRGEIAQLDLGDVAPVRGVPCIMVRPGDSKRIKTVNARRCIPVHPELRRMGFLDFVARQRNRRGSGKLFEGEEPNSRGQWGDSFGDWFVRLLKKNRIDGNLLGMHSYRHNFEDALREADLHLTPIGQYLAGRAGGEETSSNYGAGFATAKLDTAVARIAYPGLALTHLYITDLEDEHVQMHGPVIDLSLGQEACALAV